MSPARSPWARGRFSSRCASTSSRLLFVVFDVEAIFLLAWATRFRELGVVGLIEMFAFIVILVVGLVYAWRKGVLKWT